MSLLKTRSMAEQVAEYLKEELGRGRWSGVMPGRDRLAMEFGGERGECAGRVGDSQAGGSVGGAGSGPQAPDHGTTARFKNLAADHHPAL